VREPRPLASRLLRATLLGALALAVLLLAADLLAGLTPEGNAALFVADPELSLVRKPGQDGYTWGDGHWIPCHINQQGLRGDELPAARDPAELRVLCVGDSFTFGGGVETHQAWPQQLQALLGPPETSGVRVLNGGANGWDTPWQRLYLEKRGLAQLRPDLVVLGWNWNDLNTSPDSQQQAVQHFLGAEGSWLSLLPDWDVIRSSHLYRWLYCRGPGRTRVPDAQQLAAMYETYQRTIEAVGVEPERRVAEARRKRFDGGPPDDEFWRQTDTPAWKTVRTEITRIRSLCASSGARFAVALLPEPTWEGRGPFPGAERLEALLDSLGVPWIDVQPDFMGRDPDGTPHGRRPELWQEHDPFHPDAAGQALMARSVAALLDQARLLDRRR